MSFLWVGSQIGLFIFGSAIVPIYAEIGGADGIFLWMIIGYLIPNSALCPFVGALSDMFGRKYVAAVGQILLIAGPAVVSTSHSMTQAIPGMVISGLGAGLNEMISLAGTSELVPIKKRSFYVSMIIFTISPFIPSPMWAQLIVRAKNWRYTGFLVGGYNLVGLILVIFCYFPPPRPHKRSVKEIMKTVDYWGGILSTLGVTLFMMGMQWGAYQVCSNEKPKRGDLMLTSRTVFLEQRSCTSAVHARCPSNRCFLRVGGEVRAIPNDPKGRVLERQAINDHDPPDHFLQWWKFLRHVVILANASLQCVWQ